MRRVASIIIVIVVVVAMKTEEPLEESGFLLWFSLVIMSLLWLFLSDGFLVILARRLRWRRLGFRSWSIVLNTHKNSALHRWVSSRTTFDIDARRLCVVKETP